MRAQRNEITWANKLRRVLWIAAWWLLYRFSPAPLHVWRRWVLRLFGAEVEAGAHPYPRVRIFAPWNLRMGRNSCLANDVDCYCVAPVILGEGAIVSQKSFLCTASKDYEDPEFPLLTGRIELQARSWVAADAFIGPGVTIREGAVVGARACVTSDVEAWTVVAGNPARFVKRRSLRAGHAELYARV